MANIFNIPASLAFLDILAEDLVAKNLQLENAIIFLPTRRSMFELRKALQKLGVKRLPNIEPLGDVDVENIFLKKIPDLQNIPAAISRSQRVILLAKMIEKNGTSKTLFQSINIAKSLATLLDEVQNKEASLDDLENIVAEEFAEYWQITLDFLDVIINQWASYKLENNIIEPIERRNLILKSAAEFYKNNPPEFPIIIAGTTGTVPATLQLVESILSSENGYLYIRGLDKTFSDMEFKSLPENHSQFNLANMLGSLRQEISHISNVAEVIDTKRESFISTALLPVEKIAEWQSFDTSDKAEDIQLIECEDSEEEAIVIAFIIREAVEKGDEQVNIVSNNNNLFKKIKAKLNIWSLEINNVVATSLLKSEASRLLISLAEMCESQFDSVKFLSFFKQARIPDELKEKAREIELTQLRGLALDAFYPWQYGVEIEGLKEFAGVFKSNSISFKEIVNQHIQLAKHIAGDDIFDEDMEEFITQLNEISSYIGEIDPLQYSHILRDFLSQTKIWPPFDDDLKINFLSPIEARLLKADLVIFADMNDGNFPNLQKPNEFLNQSMRATIGLDSLDRAVGQQAHDFELLSKQGRLIYTRAIKSGGSPAQKSRFLESLTTLATLDNGAKYRHWVKQYYGIEKAIPCEQPKPYPPVEARPKRLSVTKVGMLMRDPYSVYAEKILKLRKLDEIDKDIEASDFGNFVHNAIEKYFENYDGQLESLLEVGKQELLKFENKIGAETFWWPRFKKIANWLIEQGAGKGEVKHEITGIYKIGDFEITAKADRVEISDRIKIIDYKTGIVPKNSDVLLGLDPQLPLEAIIFSNIYKKRIESIEFWSIKGSSNEEEKIVPVFCDDFDELVISAKEGVEKLVNKFANANTPYIARPRPAYALKYNNYEHLARNEEWDS